MNVVIDLEDFDATCSESNQYRIQGGGSHNSELYLATSYGKSHVVLVRFLRSIDVATGN